MKTWMIALVVLAVLVVVAVAAVAAMTLVQMYFTPVPGGPWLPSGGSCQRPCHISLEGPNSCVRAAEPMACTMEYRLGDACMQYISCSGDADSCTTETGPDFDNCINCYKMCAASEGGFEGCENLCRPS